MNQSVCRDLTDNYEKDAAVTVVLQSSLMMAKNMLVTVSNQLLAVNGMLNLILFALIGCLYIRLAFRHKIKIARSVFILLCAVVLFVAVSYIVHQDLFSYPLVIQALYLFAVNSIPVLILFPTMKSADSLLECFYKSSFVLVIVVIICVPLFLANQGSGSISDYSMSYGQAAMVPCMFLYSKFFKDKDIKALVLAIISNICVLLVGSRFPLLCIGVFVSIKLMNRIRKSKYKYLIIFVPVVFVLLYINHEYILSVLNNYMNGIGIHSRTLAFLADGRIMNDSGRSEIYKVVYEALKESPIFGYGFGGGYIVVNGMTHSIILDILCNLGIPIGLGFMIWFCYQYITRILKNKNDYSYVDLMFIFGCIFLPKATFGGELWETDKLWWVIALIIMDKHRKRSINANNENLVCDGSVERTPDNSL